MVGPAASQTGRRCEVLEKTNWLFLILFQVSVPVPAPLVVLVVGRLAVGDRSVDFHLDFGRGRHFGGEQLASVAGRRRRGWRQRRRRRRRTTSAAAARTAAAAAALASGAL